MSQKGVLLLCMDFGTMILLLYSSRSSEIVSNLPIFESTVALALGQPNLQNAEHNNYYGFLLLCLAIFVQHFCSGFSQLPGL